MTMQMFADYKFERQGMKVLEHDWGFLSYKELKDECFIEDLYIVPAKRGNRQCAMLLDEVTRVAQNGGLKWLSGNVSLAAPKAEHALKSFLHYGFKIQSANNNVLLLVKKLEKSDG